MDWAVVREITRFAEGIAELMTAQQQVGEELVVMAHIHTGDDPVPIIHLILPDYGITDIDNRIRRLKVKVSYFYVYCFRLSSLHHTAKQAKSGQESNK